MAIIIVTCLSREPAHAQSGTDVSPAVPVHPDVPTILRLPETIESAWIHYGDDFRVKGVGRDVYVRPRPGTPAGAEALLEVKTRTMHRIFLLRVVTRAEDATRELPVPAASAAQVDEVDPDAAPDALAPAEPAAGALASAPSPAPALTPEPPAPIPEAAPAAPEPPAPATASTADEARAPATAMSPRFDLSLHAFAGVGFAGLDVAGYEPQVGFQPLHALGVRLAGARPGAPWALEVSVSGERLTGSMTYQGGSDSLLEVRGSWLRAEAGTRARLVRKAWTPSAYVGVGAQVYLRQTEGTEPLAGEPEFPVSTMKYGVVWTLGIGLQRRVGEVLLGVEFQARQGSPNDYHAVEALWTVGYSLGKENEL